RALHSFSQCVGDHRALHSFPTRRSSDLEAHQGYGSWLHGEAVGAGMVMALDMSAELGWLTDQDRQRARNIIAAAGLPITPPPSMRAEDFRRLMSVDKKVLDGQVRLVLLQQLGQAVVTGAFDGSALDTVLAGIGQ